MEVVTWLYKSSDEPSMRDCNEHQIKPLSIIIIIIIIIIIFIIIITIIIIIIIIKIFI